MSTNYILIDFENVQPKNLEVLSGHTFKVFVFVGASQGKITFDLAAAMQHLGENARYIKIGGNGKNALDFHLAYYIGELAASDPASVFHIISKDSGFDPLIKHLDSRGIQVKRVKDLAEIPILRMSNSVSDEQKIMAIVKNLKGRGQSRPRKVKTLTNTIISLFANKLKESEQESLLKELETRGYIAVNKGNVTYTLPDKLAHNK